MEKQYYEMIADEQELVWFFNHVMQKPLPWESYTVIFVCRKKKLTTEERANLGLTTSESEFLDTQVIRAPKISFKDAGKGEKKERVEAPFTPDRLIKAVKKFNVDKGAYTSSTGQPLPDKALAVIFYVNPCSDIKVADAVLGRIDEHKSRITNTMANGKELDDCIDQFQAFSNLVDDVKHFKAQCKGSSYWTDFDVDVPKWFNEYYPQMKSVLTDMFGKGNYVIVSTSGGYHVLIRNTSIKGDPADFCKAVKSIYELGVTNGWPEHLDENGKLKFEAVKTSFENKKTGETSIPGLPLPGTYQYGRPVTVLNKEDFE